MSCTRCGQPGPTAGSIEYFGPKSHDVLELCAWCVAAFASFLQPLVVDDPDDVAVELVHAPGCPCGQCDADIRWEARRDNTAA